MVIRPCAYIRRSTKEQLESLNIQRSTILEYCRNRGWPEPVIFEETISGASKTRPVMDQMMKEVKMYKYSHCLSYRCDRVARSISSLVEIITTMSERKISFISIKDGLDLSDGIMSKALIFLLGIFGEIELSLIRARVQDGLERRKAKGLPIGRPKKVEDKSIIELKQEGYSQKEISQKLNISISSVSRCFAKHRNKEN